MISANLDPGLAGLAERLVARAAKMAAARRDAILAARRDGAGHWRKARLLWPLFTQG